MSRRVSRSATRGVKSSALVHTISRSKSPRSVCANAFRQSDPSLTLAFSHVANLQYLIFQRDMWRPDDEWKCVKKGAKETDTLANPADQP